MNETVYFNDFGIVKYSQAYAWMQEARMQLAANQIDESINLFEHPATYTLGVQAQTNNILADDSQLKQLGIETFQVDRGGDVTCHNEQQLVVYPIINLRKRKIKPVQYVRSLEEIIIATLGKFNIIGERIPGKPGIWTGQNKIGSIGISIKQGITSHGFSINVNNDLSFFDYINTCGIDNLSVTSIEKKLMKKVDFDLVKKFVVNEFMKKFTISDRTIHSVNIEEIYNNNTTVRIS